MSTPIPRSKLAGNIVDPPGFSLAGTGKVCIQQFALKHPLISGQRVVAKQPLRRTSTEDTDALKLKKAWEVALAPAKSLPMNAVMMYMSGNSLQIFSIMMVFMMFKNPVQALLQTNLAFSRFETDGNKGNFLLVKAAYVAMNLLALGFGIWKVNSMGLLPYVDHDV
jgi:hypothetical protein